MFDPIPPMAPLSIGPLTVTERPVSLASLAIRRGREADVTAAAQTAGIALPHPGSYAPPAFWLAPDMWMIEGPAAQDLRADLLTIFHDAASITEQTGAWACYDLTSTTLPNLMERLSNFDFSAAADNAASRTIIDHLGCILIKHGPTTLTLYAPRSATQSLLHAITTAAKSLP